MLAECPAARVSDDALYYKICKERAAELGIDISTLHFSTVFLGNPLNFPRYESVVRLRRMVQRAEPELQADEKTKANRKRKEADCVQYARQGGRL